MAGDFTQGQAVKTERDNEFKVKLVDYQSGTGSTKGISVVSDGDSDTPGTNDFAVPIVGKTADGKFRIPNMDDAGNLLVVSTEGVSSGVVEDYKHSANVTTTDTHEKVITASKRAINIKCSVASLGLMKWDLGTFDGSSFTIVKTKFTSPAHPEAEMDLASAPTGNGTVTVRVVVTNEEGTSQDAYSTLSWEEL